MDFWKELQDFEHRRLSDINQYNVLALRSKSSYCTSLIKSAKYAMSIGRENRAWALLVMAKYYWKNSSK